MMTDQSRGGTRLNMLDQGEATLLRVFIGNDDTYEDVPLSEAIVREAKRVGVAGATVLRGLLGYGASSPIHRYDGFFSRDLPSSSRSSTPRKR
jgi:PII-like signaling protein